MLRDIPHNSHFRFDVLTSLDNFRPGWTPNRIGHAFYTYVLLANSYSEEQFTTQLPQLVRQYYGDDWDGSISLQLLTDIHLNLRLEKDIAALVLLISSVNFTNLSLARSLGRAREVGTRKAAGAQRWQLVGQFLGESVLSAVLALAVSVPLLRAGLPTLNPLSGR